MTVENISWSISTKECCRPRQGLNPRPPGLQSDGASNWATEAECIFKLKHNYRYSSQYFLQCIRNDSVLLSAFQIRGGIQHNIFLTSPQKCVAVFIRSASVGHFRRYPQHVFMKKLEKNLYFSIKKYLIWSYDLHVGFFLTKTQLLVHDKVLLAVAMKCFGTKVIAPNNISLIYPQIHHNLFITLLLGSKA